MKLHERLEDLDVKVIPGGEEKHMSHTCFIDTLLIQTETEKIDTKLLTGLFWKCTAV